MLCILNVWFEEEQILLEVLCWFLKTGLGIFKSFIEFRETSSSPLCLIISQNLTPLGKKFSLQLYQRWQPLMLQLFVRESTPCTPTGSSVSLITIDWMMDGHLTQSGPMRLFHPGNLKLGHWKTGSISWGSQVSKTLTSGSVSSSRPKPSCVSQIYGRPGIASVQGEARGRRPCRPLKESGIVSASSLSLSLPFFYSAVLNLLPFASFSPKSNSFFLK